MLQHHHDDTLSIQLIDHAQQISESSDENPFKFLKSKLSIKKLYHPEPFSLKFDKKLALKNFRLPFDVKISHQHECIIVTDSEEECLQIYNLETGEHKCTVNINHVTRYMALEKDKRLEKEYLYLSVESGLIFKFELGRLISDGINGLPLSYIWKIGETNDEEEELLLPSCIAVSYSKKYWNDTCANENAIILICDTHCRKIKLIKSSDGSLLGSISSYIPGDLLKQDIDEIDFSNHDLFSDFRHPFGICLDSNEDIIVSEYTTGLKSCNLHMLRKIDHHYISKRSLALSSPTYVMFEPVKQYFYVSEEGKSRVNVYDREGNIIHSAEGYKNSAEDQDEDIIDFQVPDGMCNAIHLNEKTGDLLLIDCEENRLLIFK